MICGYIMDAISSTTAGVSSFSCVILIIILSIVQQKTENERKKIHGGKISPLTE
jgi:hypothetical protein